MNILKQPRDIQTRINQNIAKINTLSSLELLKYSKQLVANRDIDLDMKAYLLEKINERSTQLNSNSTKQKECDMKSMIRDFKRGRK